MNENHAKKFFFEMNDIFNEIGLRYFLFLGTLLGAIREKRFILIDKDLDIGVFKEEFDVKKYDLKSLFEKNGFDTKWKFHNLKARINNNSTGLSIYKGTIEKGSKRQMHCDICSFIKLKKWRYYPRDSIKGLMVLPAKLMEELKEIKFYGKKTKVPFYAEKVLELCYGKNWRIPHKKFIAESGIGCQILPKAGDEFWWAKYEIL